MNQYRPTVAATDDQRGDPARLVDEDRAGIAKRQRNSHALADSGVRTDCGVEPNRIRPPFSRISADAQRQNELSVVAIAFGAD